jgi:arylsulfatase A-like enzyme
MPSEHGVWHNVNVTNAVSRGLYPSVRPWSCDLADSGYRLALSGKWHVSNHQPPDQFGWECCQPGRDAPPAEPPDEQGQTRSAWRKESVNLLEEGVGDLTIDRSPGQIHRPGYPEYVHYGTDENPFNDEGVTHDGIAALGRLAQADDPWCLYIGTLGPHDPYIPPQRFLDLYPEDDLPELPDTFSDAMEDKPALYRRTRHRFDQLSELEHRQAIRHYLAFCSYEDWLFGQVLDALEASGQAEETMVVFLSDHGDYVGEHGLWCKGLPAFDAAYHVPAIVRPPAGMDSARGRVVEAPIGLIDFGPTFLEMATTPDDQNMSGRSLVPWLTGETPDDWREDVFFQTNGNEVYGIQRGVMGPRWKFVFNSFDFDELYDLESDPGQVHNLASDPEHRDTVIEMHRKLWRFMVQHHDTYVNGYIMTALMDYGPGLFRDELKSLLESETKDLP